MERYPVALDMSLQKIVTEEFLGANLARNWRAIEFGLCVCDLGNRNTVRGPEDMFRGSWRLREALLPP